MLAPTLLQLGWRGTVGLIVAPFAFATIWGFGLKRDAQHSDEAHAWSCLRSSVFFIASALGLIGLSDYTPVVYKPLVQWSWGAFSVVFGVGATWLVAHDDLNNAGGHNWFTLLFSPVLSAMLGFMLLCYLNGALDLHPGQTLQAKVVKTIRRSGKNGGAFVEVVSWLDPKSTIEIQTSYATLNRISKGDTVSVHVRQGALGALWARGATLTRPTSNSVAQ